MAEERPVVRVHDLGLQLERTALAWRRTALALVVAAFVSIKAMALREDVVLGVVPVALLAVAAGTAWTGAWRYRRGGDLFIRAAAPIGGRSLAVSSGAVALAGVCAIAWVLFGWGG